MYTMSEERSPKGCWKGWSVWVCLAFLLLLPLCAFAGGSGLNTIVVVNQTSSNSCELGNYYCEKRQVPPENVLRITWLGNTSWSALDFTNSLLNPLLAMLTDRGLTNQASYVVLSMDIPFQTISASVYNSTTTALFYGVKPDPIFGQNGLSNSYAWSESSFPAAKPVASVGYSFLAVMLTGDTLAHAKQLVDRGVASDSTFPAQRVCLAKTSDSSRNIRYKLFDNASFNTQIRGVISMYRTNSDATWGQTNLLGFETGLANYSVSPDTFASGAIADSVTSKGGIIFGGNDQTSLLAFINSGAAGSYGTVAEPYADTNRFPSPQVYFYQSRGFSLAESYYQSIFTPFLGLIVGEPLAAPFAQPGSGQWLETNAQPILTGLTELGLTFNPGAKGLPLAQVDLFIDGKYFQTLTNLPPGAGDMLIVSVNGFPISYTVPTNATLTSVASGLAAAINAPANTNITKVAAFGRGDRIELRLLSTNRMADAFYFVDTPAGGVTNVAYRTSYLPEPVPPQVAPVPPGPNGAFKLHCQSPAASMPYLILASTNFQDWIPVYTNLTGAPEDFTDPDSSKYSQRFFRSLGLWPDQRPKLSLFSSNPGTLRLHADTAGSLPYTIQTSSNLVDWFPTFTNAAGGPSDFTDVWNGGVKRFYRALAGFAELPPPAFSVLGGSTNGASVLQMAGTPWPYRVEASSDLTHWTPLFTNLTVRGGQTEVSMSANSRTYLSASRSSFLDSTAYGIRLFNVYGRIQSNSVLQVTITKTNGQPISFSVTNQPSGTLASLTQQILNLINNESALQGSDGLSAEDLVIDTFGEPTFNLRARSPGLQAAAIKVSFTTSISFYTDPSVPATLTQNLSDLQPRNHLYVSAGAPSLVFQIALDTATLPDGYHELTAVAYEGSSVRTQARATLPVQVHNSNLSAAMNLLDLPNTAPVQGLYHIQIAASTNNVSAIRLFSTGGQLDGVTNQSSWTFNVDGSFLGAGLHPFYAVVETADGRRYRTQTRKVRLVNGP
jgi:uncharacterized protein (TIGR03790 family)